MKNNPGLGKKVEFEFQKLLKYLLIIGILVVSGFIVYYFFTPKSGHVIFGILDSNMSSENYPTEVSVGENISFYVFIGNRLNRDFRFRLEILKGDNNTKLTSEGSFNATSHLNITSIVKDGVNWISSVINISYSNSGFNKTIIAELWEINNQITESFYNILWLRLNVTT